jgi:hypothetical protein
MKQIMTATSQATPTAAMVSMTNRLLFVPRVAAFRARSLSGFRLFQSTSDELQLHPTAFKMWAPSVKASIGHLFF